MTQQYLHMPEMYLWTAQWYVLLEDAAQPTTVTIRYQVKRVPLEEEKSLDGIRETTYDTLVT